MKLKSFLLAFFLLGSIVTATAQQESASVVLDKAYKQAKKENKKVFVMFHASWCSWCKKMEKNMQADATKKLFDDNYVITFLTVQERKDKKELENPGADELLKKYKGEGQGIPFWVMLDAKGNVLEDSLDAKGQNLGCPASPEEVAQFTTKLKKTSKLNDRQLAVISETFIIKK